MMTVSTGEILVYLAGGRWDGVAGTDRQMATALAGSVPVLWVDPPVPFMDVARGRLKRSDPSVIGFDKVASNICRLRVPGPPGLTRALMRSIAGANLSRRVRQVVRASGSDVGAVVVATPQSRFPRGVSGRRVYYVTDNWAAGAAMMGLSQRRIERLSSMNLGDADVVVAVTPDLMQLLVAQSIDSSAIPLMLPNGCVPMPVDGSDSPPDDVPTEPFAIVVGQINERLNLTLLGAVADRGIPLVVVGPRTERDPSMTDELDRLFSRSSVHWLGPRSADKLPRYLQSASVGLTPYVDNAFNRSSFPLKTLEYLAAGLPVVSSDLPAVRWLDTDFMGLLLFSWAVWQCRAQAAAGEHRHGDEGFGCVESVGAFGQCS